MTDMSCISRRTDRAAWNVKVLDLETGDRRRRDFSDSDWGSTEAALEAAKAYRDAMLALRPADTSARRYRKQRREQRDADAIAESRYLAVAKRLLSEAEQQERRERNAVYVEAARADVQRVLTIYGVRP